MKKAIKLSAAVLLTLTMSVQTVGAASAKDQGEEQSLPAAFDLREKGVVTPVKEQSPWGTCWAFAATAATETSILTKMGATYADTGLDLSERYLAWYVARPVTENINSSQVGEGLNIYNVEIGPNHIFNFGGREQCAATLYAQGIGPVSEEDYPYCGADQRLAYKDLLANKERYIEIDMAALREFDHFSSDEVLREVAEENYEYDLERYKTYDVYSPLDDWSVTDPDEPGYGKLRGSSYTLTDNNVINYWIRNSTGDVDTNERYEQAGNEPIITWENTNLYQESIDQIKAELYAGRGVSVDFSISSDVINGDTWAVYNDHSLPSSHHAVCIVGWDDNYPASNFTHTTTPSGNMITDYAGRPLSEEKAKEITTPAGDGAWICKNSWGSETDLVEGGLVGSDGERKNANEYNWGIVDENGKHTGYFYLSYYDYSIGVPESFDFDIRENHDQENALQLDYMPASAAEWRNNNTSPMQEANVFTLDKDMRIDEVATRIRMTDNAPISGFSVTFDLYRLREGAVNPDDGEHLANCTRYFKNEGYHRTYLDSPVYLKAGDRLGVVVQQSHTFDDGTTKYCVSAQEAIDYRENPRWRRDALWGRPVVNEGESFWKAEGITDDEEAAVDGWIDISTAPLSSKLNEYLNPEMSWIYERYVEEGTTLYDFYNIDNFCIKAFGEPVTLKHIEAANASCTEDGNIEYWLDEQSGACYADKDGKTPLENTVISALGHDWGEWTETTAATETAEGVETRTCKNDPEHTETRTIPVLTHTHTLTKTDAVSASCSKSGNIEYWVCSGCGRIFSDAAGENEIEVEDTVTAPLEHSWDNGTVTTPASCTEDGVKTYTCQLCGETKTESLPKTGHEWGEWVETTAATETTEGVETRICKNDPEHTETRTTPVLKPYNKPHPDDNIPKTSDNSYSGYWIFITILSMSALVVFAAYGRSSKKKE